MSRFLSGSVSCPQCGYGDCMRIRRTVLEQLLRNGKKYRCKNLNYSNLLREAQLMELAKQKMKGIWHMLLMGLRKIKKSKSSSRMVVMMMKRMVMKIVMVFRISLIRMFS